MFQTYKKEDYVLFINFFKIFKLYNFKVKIILTPGKIIKNYF